MENKLQIWDMSLDCIRTNSGIMMNVFEPTLEMFCIEDIAHALAHVPRFAGHLNEPYSVGQHSIEVARRVPKEHKLAALLHDASEAYLLDMPTPIKNRLPEYKRIEHELMLKIAEKFGFDYPLALPIKEVDQMMVEKEWDCFVLEDSEKEQIQCWNAKKTKQVFIESYYQLKSGLWG